MLMNNPQVEKNTFINMPMDRAELPKYDDIKDRLPSPVGEGHDDAIACYY